MTSLAADLHLMAAEQFQDLRADLAEALQTHEEGGHLVWDCDHTLRHTRAWLETHGLNVAAHLDILPLLSVFCDCEVLGIEQWPPFDEKWLRVLVESSPRE